MGREAEPQGLESGQARERRQECRRMAHRRLQRVDVVVDVMARGPSDLPNTPQGFWALWADWGLLESPGRVVSGEIPGRRQL